MTALWVWIGIAAVAIALGLLAVRSDRRAKRQGHVQRGAGDISGALRTSKSTARIRRRTYGVTALPERDQYSSEDKH
jgi:hypothetical protein